MSEQTSSVYLDCLFCQLCLVLERISEPKITLHIFVTADAKAKIESLDEFPKLSCSRSDRSWILIQFQCFEVVLLLSHSLF